jgi:hypothetical protein
MRLPLGAVLIASAALAGCNRGAQEEPAANRQAASEPRTVDIPQTVTAVAAGTTPMAQRVAVLGFLNKSNGISRDLTLKPGQAVRIGDATVRLRACETTAPWEVQQLTGAFVQLGVRSPQGRWERVFSGWLYKESPSLNVVEHPIYDVWPKSCAMTHPETGASTVRAAPPASRRSSAPNSAPTLAAASPAARAAAAEPSGAPADSAASNNTR